MTITVESYTAGSLSANSTCSVTVASCVAGETLVICHIWDGAVTENSPTCSGETVSAVGTQGTGTSGGAAKFRWHVISNIQSSGNKTVTATLSGAPSSANGVYAWRLSGTDNGSSSPYDTSVNATGTTTNPSTSLTTSASNAAIMAVCDSNSGISTAGAGYTGRTIFGWTLGEDNSNVGAAGSKTVPFTHATTTDWGLTAIAIRSADGTSGVDLTGSATAGATGSATITVQRNLASAAVAGALASGTLHIDRALTSSAIGAALGSATLSAFTKVWRVATNAPNGTTVKIMIVSGTSPNYTIAQQGTAVVAGGYADLPTDGTPGTLSFAFMHNYNDNTATTSIYGGGYIATLTSI